MTPTEQTGRRVAVTASLLTILNNLLFVVPSVLAHTATLVIWLGLFQTGLSVAMGLTLSLGHRWARTGLLVAQLPLLPWLVIWAILTLANLGFDPLGVRSYLTATSGLQTAVLAGLLSLSATLYLIVGVLLFKSGSIEAYLSLSERHGQLSSLSTLGNDDGV